MQDHATFFDSLFSRDIAAMDSIGFLEQLTKEHPYFSPAQFYLLQQTKADSDRYKNIAAKTSIVFNNPYWLNFQLKQPSAAVLINEEDTSVEDSINDTDSPSAMEGSTNNDGTTPQPLKIELKFPDASDEKFLFEPLYARDYFASQGIKFSDEINPTDKLGKQLKSFTDWIKTMKRIHADTLPEERDENRDTRIRSLAEKSNTEGEVLTEAMADVLLQQGKAAKAIEVYQKLSLLDPAKNAYFAAKIEQLKHS